jgi:hypothetical protein
MIRAADSARCRKHCPSPEILAKIVPMYVGDSLMHYTVSATIR